MKTIKKIENKSKETKIKKELKEKNKSIAVDNRLEKNQQKIDKKISIKNAKTIIKLNKSPKGVRKMWNSTPDTIIDIKSVKKIYATKISQFIAIDNINLEIKKGEFVVILGPSGSGKTTLLNMISGLDRTTYGDVIINGQNIEALRDRELTLFRRKNIGFIFQSYNLLSSLNVHDNIEIGEALQHDRKKRMSIDDLLKTIGMDAQEKKRIYELSGGQQQRVSIARALAKGPLILIGDEPTGALDLKTSNIVLKLFQEINKKFGTTVIIVTHNNDVATLANKVIHVVDGSIKEIKIQKPRMI